MLDEKNNAPVVRLFAEHVPTWQRFQTDLMVPSLASANSQKKSATAPTIHPYQRQYAHVYHQRLAMLGPLVWKRLQRMEEQQQLGTQAVTKVARILELREDEESAVVGTVVVEKQQQPQKGDEKEKSVTTTRSYYLEDESGRVALALPEEDASTTIYCTGTVLGLVGTVGVDGVLQVSQVVTASQVEVLEEPSASQLPSRIADKNNEAPHVLLVSGLECGSPQASSLPRDMLVAYIQGQFGRTAACKISHVIVAGGLVSPEAETHGSRELDGFAWQLTSTGVPLTVLPGRDDPTTANWPQRPIHRALMPRSSNYLLNRSPNPYAAKLNVEDNDSTATKTVSILGTDGTNVTDLASQAECTELDALQRTVEYAHVCPTGPDSVPTLPHKETDPMVLTEAPALYFAGNCSEFATRLIQVHNNNATTTKCRLVCLPKFLDTGVACLVNLETLDVELVRFEE